MFGGKVGVPMVIRTPGRRGRAAHGAALAEPRGHVRAHARASRSSRPRRRSTPTACSRPRSATTTRCCSSRTSCSTTSAARCPSRATTSRCRSAARSVVREGTDLTIIAHSLHGAPRADGRRPPLRSTASRSRSSTCARCGRWTPRRSARASRKTSRALVAEEGWATYGIGAEVAARISRECFDDLDAPVERVGGAEVPMPYAKPLELAALTARGQDREGRAAACSPSADCCRRR